MYFDLILRDQVLSYLIYIFSKHLVQIYDLVQRNRNLVFVQHILCNRFFSTFNDACEHWQKFTYIYVAFWQHFEIMGIFYIDPHIYKANVQVSF